MRTLLHGAGLIDGTGSGFRPGVGLAIVGERIVAVGPASELRAGAERSVDLGDAVLVPGFVDAHTHVSIRPGEGDQHGQLAAPLAWQAIRGVQNLRRMLGSGVTTARIMGERDGLDLLFRAATADGEVPGPRLFVPATALSASDGHGRSLGVADGVREVRKQVAANAREGCDHIKIFVTGGVSSEGGDVYDHHYDREEVRAIVEEAEAAGLRVAAHAHGGPGVDICVEEGVDSIEHGALLTETNLAKMKATGTRLTLTNTIAFHPDGIERGDADNPGILAKLDRVRSAVEETFERILDSGIPFAVGTDSMHGLIGYEMEWLVERGVTPEAALMAATRSGAEVIGAEAEFGTLVPNALADVVALGGDPVEDISRVYDVRAVWKAGVLAYRSQD